MAQIGAAGGILFIVLQLVSQFFIQIGGSEPSFEASADEIVAFFDARDSFLFYTGGYLSTLSVIPMLGFLASLRGALGRAEGDGGWLTPVATGAGLLFLALLAGGGFWHLAVFRAEGIDPQISRLLFDLGNFNFASMWVVLGSLVIAAGLVTVRYGAFPKWLGWSGLVIGIGLVVARIFWTSTVAFTPYVLFWVWLAAISIVMIRRSRAELDGA
jgi:hypothetical protein